MAVSHVEYLHLTQKTKNNATTSNTSDARVNILKALLTGLNGGYDVFIAIKYLTSIQS